MAAKFEDLRFRIWDTGKKKMYYSTAPTWFLCVNPKDWFAIVRDGGESYAISSGRSLLMRSFRIVIDEKQVAEFYEDDIVETDEVGWIGRVVWGNGFWMVVDQLQGFSSYCNWTEFKRLGNVWENPDIKPELCNI